MEFGYRGWSSYLTSVPAFGSAKVPEFRGPAGIGKPVAHVEDAIAKIARGISEELQIWRFGTAGIRYNSPAIPRRKKPEPLGNIACWSGEVSKVAQQNAACGDDPDDSVCRSKTSSLLRHLLRVDQEWSSDIKSWSLHIIRQKSLRAVGVNDDTQKQQTCGTWVLQVYWGQGVCPSERPRGGWSWRCGHKKMSWQGPTVK